MVEESCSSHAFPRMYDITGIIETGFFLLDVNVVVLIECLTGFVRCNLYVTLSESETW